MNSKMRAIRMEKFGSPSVLQLQTVEQPAVPEDKVLVEIVSAGVSRSDTYVREGSLRIHPKIPFTPGLEGAGIIRGIGKKITRFRVGQRVFVCERNFGQYGTYAEYSLANEDDVFLLTDNLSFDEGAALGIPYFTAYRALVINTKCAANETVLVHGASGATGLAVVQIAKHQGLRVIGTAGTLEGMDVVKGAGADFVLCHRDNDYLKEVLEITENKGVDIIIELVGHVNLPNDLDVLATKGRLVIVGIKNHTGIDSRIIKEKELQVFGVALFKSTKAEWEETSAAIQRLCREGWIKPVINKKYPLALASQAHKDLTNSPGAKGKLILSVREQGRI